MTNEKWKPPWHTGFGWVVFGALLGYMMSFLLSRVFAEELPWYWGIFGGAVIGSINWWWCWYEWAEFGPDWDGGM
jgi:hypothetical protein